MRAFKHPVFTLLAGIAAFLTLPGTALADDLFGYDHRFYVDSDAPYIDIEATGRTALGRGNTVSTLELDTPFTFYGNSFSSIRVSKNGYLSTDLSDQGTDSTPDNPLPQMASVGGGDRVYAGHSSLGNPATGDSRVIYQYFGSSPHPHHTGGVHVITWLNFVKSGAPNEPLTFQVLLFDNTDILVQFPDERYLDIDSASAATVGIQNSFAGSGIGFNVPSHSINGWLFEMPTVTVTSANDEETNNGLTSLREAVGMLTDGSSNRGGKIEFAPSVNGLALTLTDKLEIPKPVSIDASGLRNRFTIRTTGNNGFSIEAESHLQILGVDFTNTLVPLEQTFFQEPLFLHDCTVTDCTSAILGAGDVIATGCTFSKNSANTIRCINPQIPGVVRVENCTFDNNESIEYGGAINAQGDYRVTVLNSTFTSNSARQSGGAISALEAVSLDVRDCVFDRNTAETDFGDADIPSYRQGGGAIFVADTPLDVRSSLFEANTSEDIDVGGGFPVINGAAVHAENGDVTMRECTLANHKGRTVVSNASNSAPRNGDITLANTTITGNLGNVIISLGTIGDLRLSHCTFARNQNVDSPIGPALIDINTDGLVRVSHCIFAENQLTEGDMIFDINPSKNPTFDNLGYNLLDTDQAQFDSGFRDQEDTDPQLGAYGDHGGAVPTLPLPKTSPAVDTGDGGMLFPPTTDARGFPRVSAGTAGAHQTLDIGAFELQGGIQVTTAVDEDLQPGGGISLREALAAIDDSGTITFHPDLNGETLFTALPPLPLIPANATIDASALSNGVVLNRTTSSNSYRTVTGGNVTLRNITITGNGRIVTEGDATFTDCTFTDVASGVIFAKGDLTMTRCLVEDSPGITVQPNGGAAATVDISDSRFLGCSSYALNLAASPTTATITRTHVDRTEVGTATIGAAIRIGTGNLTLDSTTVSNTSADNDGSAIRVLEARLVAINSTISGNSTSGNGAAIWADGGSPLGLRHCTVVGNLAGGETGGVHLEGGATLDLSHTILAGNRGGDPDDFQNVNAPGSVGSAGYNICDLVEFDGLSTDLRGVQPLLGPLSRYGSTMGFPMPVHAPLAISPVIDAGSTDTRAIDQRGFQGTVGTRTDIGAVEAGPATTVADAVSLSAALAAASDSDRILFDPALSGITLDTSGTAAGFTVANAVQIDITTVPNGIMLDAGDSARLFAIADGTEAAIHGLDIERGMNPGSGGGIYVGVNASLTFTHGSVGDCESGDHGGGIHMAGGNDCYLNLLNASISRNRSADDGAGLFIGTGTHADIAYSTIAYNRASSLGPTSGIELFGRATASVVSTVIAENAFAGNPANLTNFGQSNTSTTFGEKFESLGFLVTDSAATGQLADVFIGSDQTATDATEDLSLVLISDGGWARTHAIFSASSALIDTNQKRNALPPVLDARGFARSFGAGPDSGAYEWNGDILDSDGDGMPDYWEYWYGLKALDPSDANEDLDGDGTINLLEFHWGSNPKTIDMPQLELPVVVAVSKVGDNILYSLAGQASVTFDVETSTNLASWTKVGTITTQGFTNPVDASVAVRVGVEKIFVRFVLP